jgi:hypothetical protein
MRPLKAAERSGALHLSAASDPKADTNVTGGGCYSHEMEPHPATSQFIRSACRRPGMYMVDYDLRDLELQLHGFDAGLAAAGVVSPYSRFNRDFTNFCYRRRKTDPPSPK